MTSKPLSAVEKAAYTAGYKAGFAAGENRVKGQVREWMHGQPDREQAARDQVMRSWRAWYDDMPQELQVVIDAYNAARRNKALLSELSDIEDVA